MVELFAAHGRSHRPLFGIVVLASLVAPALEVGFLGGSVVMEFVVAAPSLRPSSAVRTVAVARRSTT